MSVQYLQTKTGLSRIEINEQDLTDLFVSFAVSDSSAFKNGIVTTTGKVILGKESQLDDRSFTRLRFKRGQKVELWVTIDTVVRKHPRGALFVLGTNYDIEKEQWVVEVGCRLALSRLTDNIDSFKDLVPIELDPARETFENCAASFQAAGMVLYQNNSYTLTPFALFTEGKYALDGGWTSLIGTTTLAVNPLALAPPVPDSITLSYQYEADPEEEEEEEEEGGEADRTGEIQTIKETSNYFLAYPATVWKRNPDPTPTGERAVPQAVTDPGAFDPSEETACGQSPLPPNPNPELEAETETFFLCSDKWTTDRATIYLPARRVSSSQSIYGGPGAQLSYSKQTISAPEIEANSSYFADKYAFCVSVYGNVCNPSGSCEYYGLDRYILSRIETTYIYGEANELIRTVQDTYETLLSAARPNDYRAGIDNGVPLVFDFSLSAGRGMYRRSRVITNTVSNGSTTIQTTTTYTSMASRGVGINAGVSLDALDGIVTTVVRESTITGILQVRPDSLNTPVTKLVTASSDTVVESAEIGGLSGAYDNQEYAEAGPWIIEESMPIPLLGLTGGQRREVVDNYSGYLSTFYRGLALGMQVGEVIRKSWVSAWKPCMPVRLMDPQGPGALLMMDAASWGVTRDETIVVFNGIYVAGERGAVSIASNLVGNTRPNMTRPAPGGTIIPNPTPTPDPSPEPDVPNPDNPTNYSQIIQVNLNLSADAFSYFPNGVQPNPTDLSAFVETAIVPYVRGFVVTEGTLLSADGNGSVPADYNGSLISPAATVDDIIDPDIFSAAS